MLSRLSPCTRCQRHIRNTESSCPFCGSERASLRVHATALLTSVALLTGCGARPEEKPKPSPAEVKPEAAPTPQPTLQPKPLIPEQPSVQLYGAPPPPLDPPTPIPTPASMTTEKKPTKPVTEEKKPTKPIVVEPPEPQRKIYGAPPPRNPKEDPLGPK